MSNERHSKEKNREREEGRGVLRKQKEILGKEQVQLKGSDLAKRQREREPV